MVVVIGYCPVDGLLRADSVLVVGIGNGICTICRTRQPAPLPCHRIAAIGGRITVRVVTDVLAIVTRELIRPLLIGAVVPIGDRICRFLQRPAVGNIGVLLFGEQIPPVVIGVDNRLVQQAVVLTGELVQTVVLVVDMVRPLLNVRDVPVCIIAEQQLVISGDLRDEHRAVVAVAGGRSIDGLLCADAVLVIGIGNGICAVCRAHQPAALPRHRITAISGRIAGSVIADVLAVVTRQLVCSGAACQRLPPRLLFQRFFIPGTMLFYQ